MTLAQPTAVPETRKLEAEDEEKETPVLRVQRDALVTRAQRQLITDHFAAAPLGPPPREVELVVWM